MNRKPTNVAGVILAGGLAKRMQNADKGLVTLNGKTLISYVLSALSTVLDEIYISANRNEVNYTDFGYVILNDPILNFSGPLAGILSAMYYTQAEVLLVAPCDCPLIKAEHFTAMLNKLTSGNCDIIVAFDGERLHPVFLALKTSLRDSIATYLNQGERKVENWLKQHNWKIMDFSHDKQIFTNINTYEDLAAVELLFNGEHY